MKPTKGGGVIKVLLLGVALLLIILIRHSEPVAPKEDNLTYTNPPIIYEEAHVRQDHSTQEYMPTQDEEDDLVYINPIISPEPPTWQDCNAPVYIPTQYEIDEVAKLLYGEARNCSVEGQAGVVWCILNRVDCDDPYFPDTIIGVVTQPTQFFGYNKDHPVLPELAGIAEDVLLRYSAERSGIEDVGRVLPREYLYFSGDGTQNFFTVTYGTNDVWDWSLYNPYTE